jgi:GTP-dependent phosphoenolpyruvate carboxykinase
MKCCSRGRQLYVLGGRTQTRGKTNICTQSGVEITDSTFLTSEFSTVVVVVVVDVVFPPQTT